MKIAHYISDLLYEHECVVIPGLGGFISKDQAAQINPLKHQFKPPFREIVFNPHLRANDGLLLSAIAQNENISYQDAKSNLDRFIHKCIDGLNTGRRIHFRNIGSIYYAEDKQIIFQADENQNYMASSFGLSSFVSPSIERDGIPEKIENRIFRRNQETKEPKEVPVKEKIQNTRATSRAEMKKKMVASKRPNPYMRQVYFIAGLVIFLGVSWTYMHRYRVEYYYNTYAGLVPFFYASPNDYMAVNSEKYPIYRILPKVIAISSLDKSRADKKPVVENNLEPALIEEKIVQNTDQDQDTEQDTNTFNYFPDQIESDTSAGQNTEITQDQPVDQDIEQPKIENIEPVAEEKVEAEVVITKPQGQQYLIIAGAFREKANAEKLINDLRAKGYSADFAGQNKIGLWMVSIERFDELNEAKERLMVIRKEESADYWILKV